MQDRDEGFPYFALGWSYFPILSENEAFGKI